MNNAPGSDPNNQIDRYAGFLAADPENQTLLFSLGELCHRAGRFEESADYFDKLLQLNPDHSTARSHLANLQISRHRFLEAEEMLRSLGEEQLADPVLQHNLGLSLYYQEKFEDALKGFEAASEGGVCTPENLAYQAHCLHHQGDIGRALECATESMQMAPGTKIESYVALLHLDNGNLETADDMARHVLQSEPDNVDANIVAGIYALQQQEVDQAMRFLDVSLRGEPNNSRGWMGLGLVRMYDQDFDGAVEAFHKSLEHNPRNAGTWVTIGWAHIARGDLVNSEAAYFRALELDRNFGEAHGGLAVVYALDKREDVAKDEIRKARALNKSSFGAMFAQTILLEARGQRDRAVRLLASAFQTSPGAGSMTLIEAIEIFSRRQSAKQGPNRLLKKD